MSGPAELIVVRHGETKWNVEGRLQGQLDSPLTPRGLAQARALGRRLQGVNVERVVSSDLGRAQVTARVITEVCGAQAELESHPDLRERHFGLLQGRRVEEFSSAEQLHYDRSRDDAGYRVPEGESRAEVWDRAVSAVEKLGRAGSGRILLVVTHGGVLSAAIRAALGIPRNVPRTFHTPNCGFNHLLFEDGRLLVRCIGDTSHLAQVD